jgi:hypothetical protein
MSERAVVTSMLVVRFPRDPRRFGGTQYLLRQWRVFGVLVWTQVVDTEEVPAWAEIQLGALGSTDWRSKFRGQWS